MMLWTERASHEPANAREQALTDLAIRLGGWKAVEQAAKDFFGTRIEAQPEGLFNPKGETWLRNAAVDAFLKAQDN